MSDPVYEFKVQYVDLVKNNELLIKDKTILINKALFVGNATSKGYQKTKVEEIYNNLVNQSSQWNEDAYIIYYGLGIEIDWELKHKPTIKILSITEIQTRYIEIDKLKMRN